MGVAGAAARPASRSYWKLSSGAPIEAPSQIRFGLKANDRCLSGSAQPSAPRPPKREAAKPPLRLVVNKNDMDRELAALLAKDSRKPSEPEE